MHTDYVFSMLVIGLFYYSQDENVYPHPTELQFANNILAAKMPTKYPKTFSGLLNLFQLPLENWWPFQIPPYFEPDDSLFDSSELSIAAYEYLEQLQEREQIPEQLSGTRLQQSFDNRNFTQLIDLLEVEPDSEISQFEYVTLRKFLIEYPVTTLMKIYQVFADFRHITPERVHKLYIEAGELKNQMTYDSKLWVCTHCGPLYLKQWERASIKRTSCGLHCPRHDDNGWQSHPFRGRLVIREGIQLRTQIPGVPEIRLFNALVELHRKNSEQIPIEPELWPEMDSYDLKLVFSDEVWAIDVKDHTKPERLAKKLHPIARDGDLRWDKAFYIYPDFRDQQRKDYGQVLRTEAHKRLKGTRVLSLSYLVQEVKQKINDLKRGAR